LWIKFCRPRIYKILGRKLGKSVIELLIKNHYNQLQYIVQEFCRRVKMPFTGQQTQFQSFEIDLS